MSGADLAASSSSIGSSGFSRGCESAKAGVSKTSYPLFVILGEQSENAKIISTQMQFSCERGLKLTGCELPPLDLMPSPDRAGVCSVGACDRIWVISTHKTSK